MVEGDDSNTESKEETECCEESVVNKRITLPLFGLATYKMQGDVWLSRDHDDQERLASLCSVADSWLRQLRVQHHDFNYFCTMSMTSPRG